MCSVESHILSQEDPFEFIYEALGGTHGSELMKFVTDMYGDIVIDYRFHPDDDFELIIEKMVEQMEENV